MGEKRPEEAAKTISVSATLPVAPTGPGATSPETDLVVPGTAAIKLDGAGLAVFEVTAVNGLTAKAEVLLREGGTWRTRISNQIPANSVSASVAANTAITLVSGDLIEVECAGFYAVRLKRAAGTSATIDVRTGESAVAFLQGAGGGSSAVTIADGADANAGSTTDAVVAAGAPGTESQKLRRISSDIGGILTAITTLIAGAVRFVVGGSKTRVTASFTRPADTTAYAALDAVSDSTSAPTVLTFTSIARATGGSGYIVKANLLTSQVTNTEGFRLHLFNAAPTAINDNAACTAPLYASASSYVGTIDFPACRPTGSGATAAFANASPNTPNCLLPLAYITAADANLYGLLQTPLGFTPANAQTFSITLATEND